MLKLILRAFSKVRFLTFFALYMMLFLVRAFLTHSNIFRVLSPSQRNSIPLRKCAVVCVSRHPTLHFHNRHSFMYSHYEIMTILSKAKSFVFFKYLFEYSAIFTFSFFAQTAMTSRLFRLVRAKAPEVLISQEEKLMWNISINKSSCFISFFYRLSLRSRRFIIGTCF